MLTKFSNLHLDLQEQDDQQLQRDPQDQLRDQYEEHQHPFQQPSLAQRSLQSHSPSHEEQPQPQQLRSQDFPNLSAVLQRKHLQQQQQAIFHDIRVKRHPHGTTREAHPVDMKFQRKLRKNSREKQRREELNLKVRTVCSGAWFNIGPFSLSCSTSVR
jgi:hypothetical protein